MQRRGPYFLITALLLILFFIVGVRYGQRIERTNESVSYTLSITPTPPSIIDISKFEKYESSLCDLEFLYPKSLVILDETTPSANLELQEDIVFSFLCEKEEKEEIFFKSASPESR
jgi:hypothetical protein